jgi:hypothetical protein
MRHVTKAESQLEANISSGFKGSPDHLRARLQNQMQNQINLILQAPSSNTDKEPDTQRAALQSSRPLFP